MVKAAWPGQRWQCLRGDIARWWRRRREEKREKREKREKKERAREREEERRAGRLVGDSLLLVGVSNEGEKMGKGKSVRDMEKKRD